MAINVYLNVFKKYNAQQLKALEWRYHLLCYGTPFIIALIFCFVATQGRGKMYGPAQLWCWISSEWAFMRIALFYAPAWYEPPGNLSAPSACANKPPQDMYRRGLHHLRHVG